MDINFNQIKRDIKMDSIDTAEEKHTTLERNADVESKETNSVEIGNNETKEFIPTQKRKRKYTSMSEDTSNQSQSSNSSDNLHFSSDLNIGADERKLNVNATSKGSFRKLKFDCSFESELLGRNIVKSDFSGIKSDQISGKITDGSISTNVASQISRRNDEIIDSMMETEYTSEDSIDVAGPSGMPSEMNKKSGVMVFVCGLCPEEFERSYDFDIHYRKHKEEKLFVCDVCQREFTRKENLGRHYLTHTGEKPFVCDICQKGFAVRSSLTRHAKTHSRDEPNKCNICGGASTENWNCDKHQKEKLE